MRALNVLGIFGLLVILGGGAAAVFFFGGFFDVSANHLNPEFVDATIENVREKALARLATDQPPSSLDDPALIRTGARAYAQRGCVLCHGAPGVEWAKFSEGLNPDPPDLKDAAQDLLPQQVFWVIRNGIKMTGMPSFAASDPPVPDPEIWAITAFVKSLPTISDEDYKTWTAAPARR